MTEAVVGVGNPICSDDGVGAAVVDALGANEDSPAGERGRASTETDVAGPVVHAGTNAFLALEAMDGADRAVLVDAVSVGEPPGTVVRLPFDGTSFARDVDVTMHDFSVAEAFRAGREAYDLPASVWLVGVVPVSLSPGTDLSAPVREQVPAAVECVRTILADEATGAATTRPGESAAGSRERTHAR